MISSIQNVSLPEEQRKSWVQFLEPVNRWPETLYWEHHGRTRVAPYIYISFNDII